ncbi:hypothetical protein K438DRAFT_1985074 [Mycena galopus ATCC 62051]|nr:hypothetical protein K438DRAFT_1985074 [Mycena galopus ATCC 62051]
MVGSSHSTSWTMLLARLLANLHIDSRALFVRDGRISVTLINTGGLHAIVMDLLTKLFWGRTHTRPQLKVLYDPRTDSVLVDITNNHSKDQLALANPEFVQACRETLGPAKGLEEGPVWFRSDLTAVPEGYPYEFQGIHQLPDSPTPTHFSPLDSPSKNQVHFFRRPFSGPRCCEPFAITPDLEELAVPKTAVVPLTLEKPSSRRLRRSSLDLRAYPGRICHRSGSIGPTGYSERHTPCPELHGRAEHRALRSLPTPRGATDQNLATLIQSVLDDLNTALNTLVPSPALTAHSTLWTPPFRASSRRIIFLRHLSLQDYNFKVTRLAQHYLEAFAAPHLDSSSGQFRAVSSFTLHGNVDRLRWARPQARARL